MLETPELYDSLFPGYEAARGDAGLWRRYFTELFDQTVYSPALMKASAAPSLRVSASSFGSLDLFRTYGADVLVFGVSDTFIPVSAGLLRDGLDELGLRGLKILQCARGNLTPEAVAWYAEGLQGVPQRSELAIWGYSLTNAHRQPLAGMLRRDLLGLYKSWRAENNIARFDLRFPHPSWDALVGAPASAGGGAEDVPPGVLIPDAAAADPKALDAFLDRADASEYAIGHDEADCHMAAESRGVDRALEELLKVSDKVLLYIPPTAPIARRGTAACLLPSLTAMLRSKAGPRVAVETADWTSYGVTNRDYLYPAGKGAWRIDPIHANDAGARKITRALARRAAAALAAPDASEHLTR